MVHAPAKEARDASECWTEGGGPLGPVVVLLYLLMAGIPLDYDIEMDGKPPTWSS